MRSSTASALHRSAIASVLAIGAMLAATFLAAAPAAADHEVDPARLDGDTRFETAAEIADFTFPDGSGVAMVANGMGFADALAASPLSRSTDAPLLLVQHDDIPSATDQAFDDLGVREVVLLGGIDAISAGVEAELEERFDSVTRFAGDTRFETAVRIAQSIDQSPNAEIGEIGGARTAMIVNAFAAADAVVAGSYAAGQADPFPILFTDRDRLTPMTERALRDLDIDQVLVIGGHLAVSDEVVQHLGAQGFEPTRLGGQDRLETATRVADHARGTLGWDASLVNLVRGDVFADALASGPYAGRAGAPVLFTENPSVLGANTASWLAERCPEISAIRAIGGQDAVSTGVLEDAIRQAESCHDGTETGQTYIVAPQEPIEMNPGQRYEFTVGARYDGASFTGPVNVAIFPCESADVIGAGPDTFQDADGDGIADGLGTSDTGSAAIVDINGQGIGATGQVTNTQPGADDLLRIGLAAEAPDCVVLAVYDDLDDDGQLGVDSDGVPTEPYGVGGLSWT